jgi:hypothetical protein
MKKRSFFYNLIPKTFIMGIAIFMVALLTTNTPVEAISPYLGLAGFVLSVGAVITAQYLFKKT